jgi:hypothetical protein
LDAHTIIKKKIEPIGIIAAIPEELQTLLDAMTGASVAARTGTRSLLVEIRR